MRVGLIKSPNILSTSNASVMALRSTARSQNREKPSTVVPSAELLPGWSTAATMKPRAASAVPSHASPDDAPPCRGEQRGGGCRERAAGAASGPALPALKEGTIGGPIHCGAARASATAGYQIIVWSACALAPRQS